MPPDAAAAVALVTGAAGGIGRAVVARLRSRGMRICAADIAQRAGRDHDAAFLAATLDVTDEDAVRDTFADCSKHFGRIDHVIHLAGRAGSGPLQTVTREEWQRLLDVNLTSAFLIARAAHAHLRASRGSLTLMASTNAINGGSALSGPAYAAAKAGVLNLTRYLAKEWAEEGIRVNCLVPGPIDTPMVGRFDAATRARITASVPLGRIGSPQDVAVAVDHLVSPDAGFVTGTVMNVSGGLLLD
jgi:3-oxoacyl-[acyl-carrier protein] reductase